jgi:transposase
VGVERVEAEAIYDAGREAVVEVLLAMDRRIVQLEARVEKLERQLAKNSGNSSRPPSSDPPRRAVGRGKDRSGRKPGGQPGHEGHGRPLLPAWAVDEVVDHWPASCDCGYVFSEGDRVALGEPARHQVEELPVITVRVSEHRCQRVRCPGCGARRTGQLPREVAAGHLGPRLQAAITTLSIRNRVSRRDAVELGEELFQARLSTGTVAGVLARVAGALAEPHEDLLDAVRASRHLNMDETGWRLHGSQRALWGAFTDEHAYFQIAPDRHEDHAKVLLAHTTAIVTSDRWWAYSHLPLARRQICWAHLRRDFTAHAEGLAVEKQFGELGLHVCERLFWAWEVFQHTRDRRELARQVRLLRRELKPALRRFSGKSPRNKYCRGMARNLLKLWPALWTFATVPGVHPTNNHAERSLRGAVIYRKLSLGSQSEQGEQHVARLLSASITCRLQHRSLHTYLIDLLNAHARGDPTPLLS